MRSRSWMIGLALVAALLRPGPALAFSFFGNDGLFPKLGAIAATPVTSTVSTVKTAIEKPTLENLGKATIAPLIAAKDTVDKTIDTINETVERNPGLKKAVEGKQIAVSIPIGEPPPSPPVSGSGPVGAPPPPRSASAEVAPALVVTAPPPNSNVHAAPDSNRGMTLIIATLTPDVPSTASANIAKNLANVVGAVDHRPVVGTSAGNPAPVVAAPDDHHVFGPSAIAESPTKPTGVAYVPPDHPNKDQYFQMESTLEQAARELNLEGAPMTRSAYRPKDDGPQPSARHAFAAIDYSAVSVPLATLMSKKLGQCYFVQIEYPGVPDSEHQRVYPFVNGNALPPRDQPRKADGNHTHVQFNEGCVQ